MTHLKQNILLPKNNTAFKRLLENNPALLHNYVNDLVSMNGGAYAEHIGTKEIQNIIHTENVIGSIFNTLTLLKSSFIGIN